MSYFSDKDLILIENLEYDPNIRPGFDFIKDALIWSDERPNDLSSEGYEKLCDLWIARSFIHKQIPFSSWKLDPYYFEEVWAAALKQKIKWPGFQRIDLTEEDKAFYEAQRAEAREAI